MSDVPDVMWLFTQLFDPVGVDCCFAVRVTGLLGLLGTTDKTRAIEHNQERNADFRRDGASERRHAKQSQVCESELYRQRKTDVYLMTVRVAALKKLATGTPARLPTAIYVAAYIFGGLFTLCEAIDNLKLRTFEIDSLMLVAAAGAAVLGAFADGALLPFLFSLTGIQQHPSRSSGMFIGIAVSGQPNEIRSPGTISGK